MIFALTIDAAYGATAQNSVQDVPNAMQGFSQNRDQMRDKKKEATFSGNVKVAQGDTTMTSEKLGAPLPNPDGVPDL
jgi:lipopolysaccharide export system protein LptA